MNKEEQKAKKILQSVLNNRRIGLAEITEVFYDSIEILLNYISKLQETNKELEEMKDTAENELRSALKENEELKEYKKLLDSTPKEEN